MPQLVSLLPFSAGAHGNASKLDSSLIHLLEALHMSKQSPSALVK